MEHLLNVIDGTPPALAVPKIRKVPPIKGPSDYPMGNPSTSYTPPDDMMQIQDITSPENVFMRKFNIFEQRPEYRSFEKFLKRRNMQCRLGFSWPDVQMTSFEKGVKITEINTSLEAEKFMNVVDTFSKLSVEIEKSFNQPKMPPELIESYQVQLPDNKTTQFQVYLEPSWHNYNRPYQLNICRNINLDNTNSYGTTNFNLSEDNNIIVAKANKDITILVEQEKKYVADSFNKYSSDEIQIISTMGSHKYNSPPKFFRFDHNCKQIAFEKRKIKGLYEIKEYKIIKCIVAHFLHKRKKEILAREIEKWTAGKTHRQHWGEFHRKADKKEKKELSRNRLTNIKQWIHDIDDKITQGNYIKPPQEKRSLTDGELPDKTKKVRFSDEVDFIDNASINKIHNLKTVLTELHMWEENNESNTQNSTFRERMDRKQENNHSEINKQPPSRKRPLKMMLEEEFKELQAKIPKYDEPVTDKKNIHLRKLLHKQRSEVKVVEHIINNERKFKLDSEKFKIHPRVFTITTEDLTVNFYQRKYKVTAEVTRNSHSEAALIHLQRMLPLLPGPAASTYKV